jgi:transcriptional regulator with XRE-family HTH domain
MKKAAELQKNIPYNSPELDAFLSMEETIDTEPIRVSMMLAAQIADAMKAKGIGKKNLADLLGKKPSVITKWLSGTHNFEINTLTAIAKVLEIKIFAFDMAEAKTQIINETHIVVSVNVLNPARMPNASKNYGYASQYNHNQLFQGHSMGNNHCIAEA